MNKGDIFYSVWYEEDYNKFHLDIHQVTNVHKGGNVTAKLLGNDRARGVYPAKTAACDTPRAAFQLAYREIHREYMQKIEMLNDFECRCYEENE